MAQTRTNKLFEYADEKQASLYRIFPTTHFLSNPTNLNNIYLWSTFFSRNLHRVATDYLGIKLHLYQIIILYLMGINQLICIVACRAAAKSFIIALYCCCKAIIKPKSQIVLGSATRGQSKLLVTEKIQNELMGMSPALNKEIKDIQSNSNETTVYFHNGSTIKVFTANDNARGLRSTDAVREEFRMIEKRIDDSVISPFQTIRQAGFMLDAFYADIEDLKENPKDIYISSSWLDGHWMWDIVDNACSDMLNDKSSILLAFDESITLKHNIRTQRQMQQEKRKQDPTTWAIEFLNLRLKDNVSSYFTYSMLINRQTSKQLFYPRSAADFKSGKKNKYAIPKLDNEIRVISNDIAFVAGSQNDNSVYSCIRGIPESANYKTETGNVEIKQGYRRIYPYLEANQIGDTTLQAIRIRQLYEDFNADYIVIDSRNGGLQVVYSLQKVLYDEERQVEYKPLKVMNNDDYSKLCQDKNAKECIFVINASQALNSEIASNYRKNLSDGKIDFLVSLSKAKEEILINENYPEYVNAVATADVETQLAFEMPFLETQLMISECSELKYEKLAQTGAIKIFEQAGKRKDRYTSCSYGSYFIDRLELDLLPAPTTDISKRRFAYSTIEF